MRRCRAGTRGTRSTTTTNGNKGARHEAKEDQVLRDAEGNPVDPSLVEFAGGGLGHAAVSVGAMALGGVAALGLAGLGAFGAYYMASSAASASGRTMLGARQQMESKREEILED